MVWAIVAVVAVILLYRFFTEPLRNAKALGFAAVRCSNKKDWTMAAKFYRRSCESAGKAKEPARSRMVCLTEIQWASVLHRMGQLSGAEDMLRRGLFQAERHFKPESEMLLQGYLCWGDVCTDEGRHSEAEQHYRKALEVDEAADNLVGMIFDLERLGDCLIRQERRSEAEQVIERAIALETRHAREFAVSKGMDPDKCLLRPTSQPALHFCRGEYEEARGLYRSQVDHWQTQAERPGNIDLGHMQMRLAMAEAKTGHFEEAAEAYDRAAAEFEREWCVGHPKALAAREAKAALAVGDTDGQ